MDDDELTPEEAAMIDAFSALLVDEAVWDGPSAGVEDLIAAQIASERITAAGTATASGAATAAGTATASGAAETPHTVQPVQTVMADTAASGNVVRLSAARGARRRNWWTLAGAAVAGAAAAALITTAVVRRDDPGTTAGSERVELRGTDLAPGAGGAAKLTTHPSGVRIDLAVTGLPDRVGGDFYQVWLKNCAGTLLVPAGSYHNLDDAVAWAGVATADYSVITVTEETAVGGKDPAQGSSGRIVASGTLGTGCPA